MKQVIPKNRIVIENITPTIDCGAFPIKRVVGEEVMVRADVYADGHDKVLAFLLYREIDKPDWREVLMKDMGNDARAGSFVIEHEKDYCYSVRGYISDSSSRRLDPKKSVTHEPHLQVSVERKRALFSSWYEVFPRSWPDKPGKHGTLKDCERILPAIARMGFDVVYLPPIHPIGKTFRKGKNNAVNCAPGDPGSPWAVGSAEGGHKAAEVARSLGIHQNQLYNWKKKFSDQGEKAFPGKGHLTELAALRRKLRDVEMERDILKKAVGIFSKTTENGSGS